MVLKLFVQDENEQVSEKYFQFLESDGWTYEIHFNTLRNDKEVLLYILNFDDVLIKNPDIMKVYEKLRGIDIFSITKVQIYAEGRLHFDSSSLLLTPVHCSGRLNGAGSNDFSIIFGFYNHIYSEEELAEIGEQEIVEEPPAPNYDLENFDLDPEFEPEEPENLNEQELEEEPILEEE